MRHSAGYVSRPLGQVCTLQRGFDLPTEQRVAGKFPLVTSSGPTDTHCEARVRGPGVVTGRSGSIGSVYFVDEDFWPLNTALYVKDFHGNDERYVFYLLEAFDLSRFASGAGVPTLNRNHVHDELVLVTSDPAEQKRIVEKLDQAFAALDRARANAEATAADLSQLRESIISSSLEVGLNQVSKRIRLAELCAIARGGSPRPISAFLTDDPDGVNWIKISDATASGKFIESTKEKIIPEGISRSRYVTSGSFLLTNSMSFGRPYILRTNGCIHDGWLVMEPDYDQVDQEYLYYLLGSRQIYDEFDRLAAGSTVRNLNIDLVSKVSIRLPSLEKQREAVTSILSAVGTVATLAKANEAKLADIAALRHSLLRAAFSGHLT